MPRTRRLSAHGRSALRAARAEADGPPGDAARLRGRLQDGGGSAHAHGFPERETLATLHGLELMGILRSGARRPTSAASPSGSDASASGQRPRRRRSAAASPASPSAASPEPPPEHPHPAAAGGLRRARQGDLAQEGLALEAGLSSSRGRTTYVSTSEPPPSSTSPFTLSTSPSSPASTGAPLKRGAARLVVHALEPLPVLHLAHAARRGVAQLHGYTDEPGVGARGPRAVGGCSSTKGSTVMGMSYLSEVSCSVRVRVTRITTFWPSSAPSPPLLRGHVDPRAGEGGLR